MDCPHCGRLLYSRRLEKCGFCGSKLPAEVLFSESEIAAIDAEREALARRHAEFKQQEEEEKLKRERENEGGLF